MPAVFGSRGPRRFCGGRLWAGKTRQSFFWKGCVVACSAATTAATVLVLLRFTAASLLLLRALVVATAPRKACGRGDHYLTYCSLLPFTYYLLPIALPFP